MAMRSSKWVWVVSAWAMLSAGCADLPDWSLFLPLQDDVPAAEVGSYHFSWRLSGDRMAGPLQVFDDGRTTWLQFAPEQTVPAIFVRTVQGDQLLGYRQQGPYVVLDGVWPVLVLRAGGLESRVERSEPSGTSATHAEQLAKTDTQGGQDKKTQVLQTPGVERVLPAAAPESMPVELVPLATQKPWSPTYEVSPQDGNIRLALSRWAMSSGWTFEAEHWAVDVDIPIAGAALFELEFDQAVQQLLAATELSDRPLQPCFYANKVLRVVPYAQSCDRTMPRERV